MQTDIYNAVLLAAEQIEKNPDSFKFLSPVRPHPCGTPSCALGWTHYFFTDSGQYWESEKFYEALALGQYWEDTSPAQVRADEVFYNRMDKIASRNSRHCWRAFPEDCAVVLRLYAEKYLCPPSKNEQSSNSKAENSTSSSSPSPTTPSTSPTPFEHFISTTLSPESSGPVENPSDEKPTSTSTFLEAARTAASSSDGSEGT